jgi:WD40 repeat protein
VKILDFGIARLARTGRDPAATDTAPQLLMGTLAYLSPEQARGFVPDPRADLFALGAVLYEMLCGRRAFTAPSVADTIAAILHDDPPPARTAFGPVPAVLDRIVRRCLHKDPAERFHSAHDLALALEAVLDRPLPGSSRPDEHGERQPYPGLSAFTEADAPRFFGRESESATLWSRLKEGRLVALIGPSGAGKTSFVRAGVAASQLTGWAVIVCTPGRAPVQQLGQCLAPHLAGDPEALRQLVRFEDEDAAVALLQRWRRGYLATVVIVDQFEELFTLNPPDVQARFARLVGRAASEAGVRVVLSMRDDFLMRCHEHSALAPVFEGLMPLSPPAGEALRRALVEPARAEGYAFEEGLVEDMLADVQGERGALPLLAFTVALLWMERDRERRLLTRASYDAAGGVAGALARHAEETLERIGAGREAKVREVFRNLVTAEGTRAAVEREELLSVFEDRVAAGEALDELVDARLLTSYEVRGRDGERRDRVEIIHESLLRAWPRLVRWRAQDAEGALLRDQLKQAARLWDEKDRPADLLWSGTSYREYALWRERYRGSLTALEEDFARAMTDRAERQKRRRHAAVLGVIGALVLVLAVIGALLARTNQALEHSVLDEARARASKLVALGRVELGRDPTAAVAYARKSLEMADTIEARLLATEALWRGPTARVLPLPEELDCSRLAFSPDGRLMACSGFRQNVAVFPRDGSAPRVLGGHESLADARGVAFGAEGRDLLTWAPGDAAVRAWSTESWTSRDLPGEALWLRVVPAGRLVTIGPSGEGPRHVVRSFRIDGTGGERTVSWDPPPGLRFDQPGIRPLAASADARTLFFGRGASVFRRDLDGRGPDARLGGHASRVRDLLLDPGDRRLLSVDEEGEFRVLAPVDGALLSTLRGAPPQRFTLPSFDPAATRVAWAAPDGIHVWRLDDPPNAEPLHLPRGDVSDFGETKFTGDGRWLAAGSFGDAAFFPADLPYARVLRGHLEGPLAFTFAPDGRQLVSCAKDGARIWPLVPGAGAARRVELGGDYYCYGVAVDRRGETLVVVSPLMGVYSVPLAGGPFRKLLDFSRRRLAVSAVALDEESRRLAVASHYGDPREDMLLYVLDLERGTVETSPLREPGGRDPWAAGVRVLRFERDGSVLAAGEGGVRRWRPGRPLERILGGPGSYAVFDASRDGRTLAVLEGRFHLGSSTLSEARITLLDLATGARRPITTHGNTLLRMIATDAQGRVIVTGDAQGTVRVGLASGEPPHLLLGHERPVRALAVSPDGRWVVSAAGSDIRLWPMPDLSRPPFHTLPLDALLGRLRELTNLEVVEDPASPTGYRTEIGPFPGWKEVPSW